VNLYLPLLLPSTAGPAARFATVDRLVAGEECSDRAGRRRERILSVVGSGGLDKRLHGRKRGRLSSDTDDEIGMALSAAGMPVPKPCSSRRPRRCLHSSPRCRRLWTKSGQAQNSVPPSTILVRKGVVGHVANRLQAALYREVVYLIKEGVVDVTDADTAVC
jgi:hypothetical protein